MPKQATEKELSTARRWFETSFAASDAGETRLPISFLYDGKESARLLKNWRLERSHPASEDGATHYRRLLTDPQTGLQCRLEVRVFDDFPAVEWIGYFKNTSKVTTPILETIQPLAVTFSLTKEQKLCRIHHAKGSLWRIDDFMPLETPFDSSCLTRDLCLCSRSGRSSSEALPFFNLQMGEAGVIGAVGWTGGWAAHFHRDGDDVHLRAGMEETHLKLFPGEEIRTPRILLLFWEGERLHAHNMLRRFILAHHSPRPNGKPLQAPICYGNWGASTTHQQIAKAHWWKENNLPLDCFWIDAGWFGDGPFREDPSTLVLSDWWNQVGNWWPNKTAYPEGLKPVGDALKEMGLGFILWFEPERVFKETYFAREHPEWLLGPINDSYLFNLGIPEARQELTNLISNFITESGITCYRQDFNQDPAPFWKAADAADRVGMSEIRHIEGLYAFWDALLTRHPGLVIDNCSSGGQRIDLETTSRSIPLWRSDFQCFENFDPIGMQGQTHGLSMWVPISTGCCVQPDTYAFRSALGPGIVINIITPNLNDRNPPLHYPVDWLRQRLAELLRVRTYFYGDFYPLLSFSLAEDGWAAWQFDRPDLGEGMVLALRRQRSPFAHMAAPLRGLDPKAQYELQKLDSGITSHALGRDLMNEGLSIPIGDKPGSALFVYKRIERRT